MYRYKCILEYDGRIFHGWQYQKNVLSLQEVFETAVKKLNHRFIRVYVSGRTDAGVHALGQVVHFDLDKLYCCSSVMNAINYYLKPNPIAILKCESVNQNFHARFSSKKRYYMYRIINRRAPLTFENGLAWGIYQPLDIDAMNEGAKYFIGTHDFSFFRSRDCQSHSPIKTLDYIKVSRNPNQKFDIRINTYGQSFLHHQVRKIVGTLVNIGKGILRPIDIKIILEKHQNDNRILTALANGLYFVKVDY